MGGGEVMVWEEVESWRERRWSDDVEVHELWWSRN